MPVFYHVLANNLVANITNYTVWFAITFWVYIETQSVFATGMIAGIYLILTAMSGIWFGSIVDHNSKRLVMLGSSVVSLIFYAIAFAVHQMAPEGSLQNVASVWLVVHPDRHDGRHRRQHPRHRAGNAGHDADPRG